jgi:hypothetical protein
VNQAELTGQTRTHITEIADPACLLHAAVAAPFLELLIWNGKFAGERPMRDAQGRLIDAHSLTPAARIDAILLWSALPGASRHHWGTDADFIDARAVPAGYQAQLTAEEFAMGGPFAPLADWLQTHAPRFGFFRPYRGVRSGVQPEPWHFSFAPTAETARRQLTPAVLYEALAGAPLRGKEWVLPRIDELHARYVATVEIP